MEADSACPPSVKATIIEDWPAFLGCIACLIQHRSQEEGQLLRTRFAYEDLGTEQFEKLVVLLCQRLLGIGVQGFAKGPDGGRDAKFVGKAELHPSKTEPWSGTTIIQAKHTNGHNRHFSESDFFSPKSTTNTLGKEIPRIRKMRQAGQLDHYMLFSNRRLAAKVDAQISEHISGECELPTASIYLCGQEQLEILLTTFRDVPHGAGLDPVDSPLLVSPDDLAEVVQCLASKKTEITSALDDPPTDRVSFDQKNVINNVTPEYAKEWRKRYLKEARQIRSFLSAPENQDILRVYESVTDEFQMKIIAKREDYQTFDNVIEYLIDLLFGRSPVLRQRAHKRLTRAVLFYMYWNCDIGELEDAQTD